MAEHREKYRVEYLQGRSARRAGKGENYCPYGMAEIGQRMSWLAGWYDADKEEK